MYAPHGIIYIEREVNNMNKITKVNGLQYKDELTGKAWVYRDGFLYHGFSHMEVTPALEVSTQFKFVQVGQPNIEDIRKEYYELLFLLKQTTAKLEDYEDVLSAYDKTRLDKGGMYYFVDLLLGVKMSYDDYTEIDNLRFDRGNYFVDVSEADEMFETILLRLRGE